MFHFSLGLEDSLKKLQERGLRGVERLGKRGNRDEWIIMQDYKDNLALFSFMVGKDIDGNDTTVVVAEKMINPQGILF